MLIAVNFHYVRPSFAYPYPGIHGISPAQFASQLKLLRRVGSFVSAAELRRTVERQQPLASPSLVVTFDDGLREQFDHAWPILRELDIPAIFFINTLPIATGTIAAVHKIHLVRAHLEPAEFERRLRHKAAERGLSLPTENDAAAATNHYIYDTPAAAQLKFLLNFSLPPAARDAIVAEVFDERFPGREMAMSRQLYLEPEQIAELGRHEAIGSHAHDHLPLGLLPTAAIETQTAMASHYLSDWAGYAPYAMSYPYGSREACSVTAADVARRCGIRFAFTMERAANPDLSRPLHLARFDNNDLPGGKAARWGIDKLFEGGGSPKWFEAVGA
ncbi:MAG TPA: polysaccharide deacetylase family protein [Pirellulales bacterium]|jgi:peptidoglycan/xylan/chitin deacetylase (PgdA/CDA1 family)|nr:polysaccharide deacetylase family protein [Pirellulales bacterium]